FKSPYLHQYFSFDLDRNWERVKKKKKKKKTKKRRFEITARRPSLELAKSLLPVPSAGAQIQRS
ncbi:hypothetical protein ACMD2_07620, partial [Ananas comosus]